MDDIPVPIPAGSTRFLDLLRAHVRAQGLAYKTEQTYVHWIVRYIRFHGVRHPSGMGADEVEQFLSHLSLSLDVSKSTQRVALNALVYLYDNGVRPTSNIRHQHGP